MFLKPSLLIILAFCLTSNLASVPLVINTWGFSEATSMGNQLIKSTKNKLVFIKNNYLSMESTS